eukprot:3103077-Rhodomonas_salina.1
MDLKDLLLQADDSNHDQQPLRQQNRLHLRNPYLGHAFRVLVQHLHLSCPPPASCQLPAYNESCQHPATL